MNMVINDILGISEIMHLIAVEAGTKSQAQLARLMDMTPQSLNNYLSGRNTGLPFVGIFKFAQKTKKPVEFYLTGTNPFDDNELIDKIRYMEQSLTQMEEERDRLYQAISSKFQPT